MSKYNSYLHIEHPIPSFIMKILSQVRKAVL